MVAREFSQRPGIDFNEIFAPVARLSSIRLLVAQAAKYEMLIQQFNVTTAYFNGIIEEEMLMEVAELLTEGLEALMKSEAKNSDLGRKAKCMVTELETRNKICRLKRSLYGWRQSGKIWYTKLNEVLKKFGAKPSNADPCVYFLDQGEDMLLIAVYVDDIFVISKNLQKIIEVKKNLSKEFDIKELGDVSYCLEIEFTRKEKKIGMHQTGYIREILNLFGMTDCKPVSTPMDIKVKLTKTEKDPSDKERELPYRELVCVLMYLAVAIRPYIAFAVSALSQFKTNYNRNHWTLDSGKARSALPEGHY